MRFCNSLHNAHWLLGLLLWLALATLSHTSAEAAPHTIPATILRPAAIVINVHRDIADTRFMAELQHRLRKRLAPPVTIQPAAIDFSDLRGFGKLDAHRLIAGLVAGTNWNHSQGVIHVFLIKDDMRLAPARFNYAVSVGSAHTAHHVIVVSLARLQETRFFDSRVDANPARTAMRAFKMIAKNTAKVAGYSGSNACLFSFPRNLAELDAMPEGFCEPDISLLNMAGITRQLR